MAVSRGAMPDPLLGRTLGGRYRLIQRLGSGGMSTVYLARHVLIDRLMAIKTLRRDLAADPVQRDRFLREARAVNRIHHENIVEITDFGESDDGLVYLVLEYVPGDSLLRVMSQEPFTIGRALDVVAQIGSALARAHQMGVVHRDLKPENVLLVQRKDRPDFVKLLDFGIAKILDAPSITSSEQIFGTPGYIAPEYIKNATLDGRADLYSLGVIFYEMVTGALPFDYQYPGDLLVKHVTEAPVPLHRRRAGLPSALEAFVLRCLEKDPSDRFRDAFQFLEQLEALRSSLGPASEPVGRAPHRTDGASEAVTREMSLPVPDLARASQPGREAPPAPTGEAPGAGIERPGLPAAWAPSPSLSPGTSVDPDARAAQDEARAIDLALARDASSRLDTTDAAAGALGVAHWRARVEAAGPAIESFEASTPVPADVADDWAAATQALEALQASLARIETHQRDVEAAASRGRRVRRTLGRAVDGAAADLSRQRGELERVAARRRALVERSALLRSRSRGREAPEDGEAEALVWELAAEEEAVRSTGEACDVLEARVFELRSQLDADSDAAAREQAVNGRLLERELRRFEALAGALGPPLDRVEAYIQTRLALLTL